MALTWSIPFPVPNCSIVVISITLHVILSVIVKRIIHFEKNKVNEKSQCVPTVQSVLCIDY